ncbi:MAG: trypsin-like peptidase domain-containing protein [Sphaerospermopsis sp. SIO1G1]|nr:trypsin-like peptidase domain-containing protein [Sphaerospermopsis sp. SIO1G1]
MKYFNSLSAILTGTVITSAIVVMQHPTLAMTGQEVNNIAREVTVLIHSINPGSGVVIAKDNNKYYVLTAKHVVANDDEYSIITADKKAHKVEYSKIRKLSGSDLAIVEFTSKEDYKVATLANSDNITEGNTVFVSGWPNPGTSIKTRIRQFTTGQVSARPDAPLAGGYQMVYSNVTRAGMSGGPVFDTNGRVVGIHGQAEGEEIHLEERKIQEQSGISPDLLTNAQRVGLNLGIPIKTFLNQAPQNGIYLGLKVENSPPADLASPYVASQPDERDKINNINDTLSTINQSINIMRGIRGLF